MNKLTFGLLIALLGISPVAAHSWYALKCCSGQDCHPISSCADLVELPDGSYKYLPTGDVFPKDSIYPSQDNHCHICVSIYSDGTRSPHCAYILQSF